MKRLLIDALVLVLALVVGFAAIEWTPLHSLISSSQPAAASAQSDVAVTPAATPTVAATSTASQSAAASPTTAQSGQAAAIQAVVEKANQEQQDAFAQNNPSLMQDTATTDYYNQMVQNNQQMASGGVSAIKLVNLQWDGVTVDSSTSATATSTETWQTTFTDSSTEQSTDQNVYTLVLSQGKWLIQADQQPGSSQSTGTAPSSTPSAVTTPSSSGSSGSTTTTSPTATVLPVSQTGQSNNWSGYSATGGSFTSVTGTWIVPQSDGTASAGASAAWVGIGGVSIRDLIQAGTQDTSNGSGSVQYSAWVETLPQSSKNVPFTVRPGDSVTVTIDEQSQSTDQWLISFKNNTTGETYQTTVQYTSSNSSAEWVQEAPSSGRRLAPLDGFGTVAFTNGMTTEDGKSDTIAQAGATPITMVDYQGNPAVSPSALSASGDGFSVTQVATSTTVPNTVPGSTITGQSGSGSGNGRGYGFSPSYVQ